MAAHSKINSKEYNDIFDETLFTFAISIGINSFLHMVL